MRSLISSLILATSAFAHDPAPLLEKLNVTAEHATATISGLSGAVAPNGWVSVVSMTTGHYAIVQASPTGSFQASLPGSPGAWFEVKADRTGDELPEILAGPRFINSHISRLSALPGTIVHAAVPASPAGLAFAGNGITTPLPIWTTTGTLDKTTYAPGETIVANGLLRVLGATTGSSFNVYLDIVPVGGDGKGAIDQGVFCSTVMTPTGFPIERLSGFVSGPRGEIGGSLAPAGADREAPYRVELRLPAAMPPGYYRPILSVRFQDLAAQPPNDVRMTTFLDIGHRRAQWGMGLHLPIITIGTPGPARFFSTMLLNTFDAGARGLTAVEDRGRFGVASHVALGGDRIVVPRENARTGAVLRYNLEPYALGYAVGERGAPLNPPLIPFAFPSGALSVSVRRPDGAVSTIGPLPFRQVVVEPVMGENGQLLEGGPHIVGTMRLSTLDPRFDVAFEQYGLHVVTVDGVIDDIQGRTWRTNGTYEVEVAKTMLLDVATIPGTPFEVGDRVATSVSLIPPVPAVVDVRFRFAPRSDATKMRDERQQVQANRFGFAHGDALTLNEPGEYRMDVSASWRAPDGVLWIGHRAWGNAVAPKNATLIAHGQRGSDDMPQFPRPQWFSRTQLGIPPSGGHTFFPWATGDVMWMVNEESGITGITVQDPVGTVSEALRNRCCTPGPNGHGHRLAFDATAATGEIELSSGTLSGIDAQIAPSLTDLWAYSYRFVERPLVRVREVIAEQRGVLTYWRFNDRYANQAGNGIDGDLPNDFKFQFGGAVVRGPALPQPEYAIYGSLFVLVPADDPLGTRTMPPFRGNGGGPDGGPLFRLKGRDIEIFLHLTAVRPGSILHRGTTVSFAGQVAPTLPAKIEIVVTSPSGAMRTIAGQANRIGYFGPRLEFFAGETGVWKAKVKVWFDGVSSAGPVTAPFPTGDVLGSREGEFFFYVVDAQSPELELKPLPRFVRPADGPIVFEAVKPAGLTDVTLTTTTTMPGFLLEEKTSTLLRYTYDARTLADDFPNLDLRDVDARAGVDPITISFLLAGTGTDGKRVHLARQVVIEGEELHMPAQLPRPPRRRALR